MLSMGLYVCLLLTIKNFASESNPTAMWNSSSETVKSISFLQDCDLDMKLAADEVEIRKVQGRKRFVGVSTFYHVAK